MSYNSSTETNCACSKDIKKDEESNFDLVLKEKWMEAQKNGVFRYILNIQDSKILEGKYHFLVQLNIDRGYKRRSPENIISMNQPFNEKDFNFTKLVSEEQIMNLNNTDKDDIIAINASPIEYCHSLLLPQRCKQLPQLVTKHSLLKAIELFSLSLSSYIRVAFNSLCAFASVNHLHWHLYYLRWRMLLEYIMQVGTGLGAVLKQTRKNGIQQPIAYFSRKLKLTESKKKTIHLECLVIKEAILYWQHWLIGRNFTVLSFSLIIFQTLFSCPCQKRSAQAILSNS
ncbi:GDP-D-glucose phosphorylase 1-like isoform X1 [Bombus vosnesenskii]|uniref:GDP-D-glucose phosphorylase 1-like isoform X1 n=1 Tax=Bombus vosnesenskii TaxID=207650 RepID=A0A6J3LC72_9HYME|nr:GDP-D-glucose phosphorylase 1-like isoform X1 [Bombus vosnesenskii]